MNIKIIYHFLPWEIDYCLLTFTQLKKSSYYLPKDVNITIDSCLNLSSYLINWEESKIPKEYFVDKYNQLSNLLSDYKHNPKIYDGNELYGHLDLQREAISKDIDYYMYVCPDIYFSENTLAYIIESLKQINDKYFVLSPQHRKLSDPSWDPTTDTIYLNIPYEDYNKIGLYDVRYNNKTVTRDVVVEDIPSGKSAGWFDVYSKAFYEDLVPIQHNWKGYGPWDWYYLIMKTIIQQHGITIKNYTFRGETIGEYWTGIMQQKNGYSGYYKDRIKLNDIPNQRQQFEAKMGEYIETGIQMLKDKKII